MFIFAALTVFTNASVWEGSAAVAAVLGELPQEGYYAATNSFPRNTVVDVTNLETGKSIRVIVSTGLDSPGLLAILSQDAAKSIGLQPKSIGRISMKAPSDPIAFSRFTEGISAGGDPDYNPRAMVTADTTERNNAKSSDTKGNPGPNLPQGLSAETQLPQQAPASIPLPSASVPAVPAPATYPYRDYIIVDVPNAYPGPSLSPDTENTEQTGKDTDWDSYWDSLPENSKPALADAENNSPESTLYPIWARGGSVGVIDGPDVDDGSIPSDIVKALGQGDAEIISLSDGRIESISSGSVYIPSGESVPPNGLGNVPLSMIPAENRPPVAPPADYVIPPEAFIAPIERPSSAQARMPPDPPSTAYLDESLFIAPIESNPVQAQSARALPGEGGETALAHLDESLFIDAVSSHFSVPSISELERGKYYLQLGTFNHSEAAKDALTKIDKSYPLAIQTGGSADKPTYRLLIGPVNLGESGALLQRFKRSGYGDAFVKSN